MQQVVKLMLSSAIFTYYYLNPFTTRHNQHLSIMLSDRELFHAVVNIEDNPHVYDQCKERLQYYLSETEPIYAKWYESDKYFEYSEENLDKFLLKENQDILREYKHLLDTDKIKTRSREEMINFLKQVAPAKLVDGCWLQNVFQVIYRCR